MSGICIYFVVNMNFLGYSLTLFTVMFTLIIAIVQISGNRYHRLVRFDITDECDQDAEGQGTFRV
jgi:hypothetical protein